MCQALAKMATGYSSAAVTMGHPALKRQAAIAAIAPTTRLCAPGLNNYGVADPIQIGGTVRVTCPAIPATLCNGLRLRGTAPGRAPGSPGWVRAIPGGLKRGLQQTALSAADGCVERLCQRPQ